MSNENVVLWRGVTKKDLPPELVLREVPIGEMESVVILGYMKNGSEYFASSLADGADVVWLMERLKTELMTVHQHMDD
jgi:hypothetical protein